MLPDTLDKQETQSARMLKFFSREVETNELRVIAPTLIHTYSPTASTHGRPHESDMDYNRHKSRLPYCLHRLNCSYEGTSEETDTCS